MTNGERFRQQSDVQIAMILGRCYECNDCQIRVTPLYLDICCHEYEDNERPECWEIIAKWFGMEAEE